MGRLYARLVISIYFVFDCYKQTILKPLMVVLLSKKRIFSSLMLKVSLKNNALSSNQHTN